MCIFFVRITWFPYSFRYNSSKRSSYKQIKLHAVRVAPDGEAGTVWSRGGLCEPDWSRAGLHLVDHVCLQPAFHQERRELWGMISPCTITVPKRNPFRSSNLTENLTVVMYVCNLTVWGFATSQRREVWTWNGDEGTISKNSSHNRTHKKMYV